MKDWPAFPRTVTYSDGSSETWPGMTLRQWYAGMAMQGLVVSADWSTTTIAEEAFRLADAMLAQEEK